jgi:hypothetical protein
VGTYLKEMYIDSALRKADKLNASDENEGENVEKAPEKKALTLSWKEFREIQQKKSKNNR